MALFVGNQEILSVEVHHNGKVTTLDEYAVGATTVARKPLITKQPLSKTITDAETYQLSISADGLGSTMTYQWFTNGGVAVPGATSTSYLFDPTSTGSFTFFCRVYGFGGYEDTDSAVVTVNASTLAPRITDDPNGGDFIEGDNYTASISVNWGGETGTIVWYLDNVVQPGSNSTSFTFNNLTLGTHKIKAKATNSVGSDTSNEATLNVKALLISEEIYLHNTSFLIAEDCVRLEAQGVGGGGGGGKSSLGARAGSGGGGASLLKTYESTNVSSGSIVTVVVGSGGAGASSEDSNGSSGTLSSLSGGGLAGFDWQGGYGGKFGQSAANGGKGGDGGNGSNNTGGGDGGTSDSRTGKDGTNGGGGGGGATIQDMTGSRGGKGSGTRGGAAGLPESTMADAGGGGGGANDAVWWDGLEPGNGGDGGSTNKGSDGGSATGYGNGGGGAAGGSADVGIPGDGSQGRIMVRQYRR